jgi:hypothetical protein
MKAPQIALGFAALALTVFITAGVALAGDKDAVPGDDHNAMMEQMMEASKPGGHHKPLKMLVGQWDVTVTQWQMPGAEPMVTEGKSKNEMVMEGRFVVQHFESEMFGMPFEGIGIVGFDKNKGKHTSVWIDNFGTQVMYTEGECANHCMTETHLTTIDGPMGEQKVKFITNIVDENKHTMEFYNLTPDGGEFKSMEIVYTRG